MSGLKGFSGLQRQQAEIGLTASHVDNLAPNLRNTAQVANPEMAAARKVAASKVG